MSEANASKTPDFRVFLQQELLRRCRQNPSYSLRAFARSLQVDHSTLAKILRGRRSIGAKTITTLGLRLGLDPEGLQQFLVHRRSRQPDGIPAANSRVDYEQLAADSFQIIADWYHYAILELLRVDGLKPNARWVARALSIPVIEAQAAIDRLVRVGLMEVRADGSWGDLSSGKTTSIGPDMSAAAHRLLQKQILMKAIEALEQTPIVRRDQTAITMAVDEEKLPEARERIKKFRRSLAKFLSRGKKRNQVFNLSVSLYPLSNVPKP